MRLPNAEQAIVDATKVRDYLLSATHPLGRAKARVFGALGFAAAESWRLADALRAHGAAGVAAAAGEGPYGRKYAVRGMLRGPTGRMMAVVSIRIVPPGSTGPRLITAYPAEELP